LQALVLLDTLAGVNRARRKTDRIKPPALRSICPISCALEILGDKWTLVVVRDLLWLNKSLYSEFCQSPEHIPTSILADRLKRLEQAGLVTKEVYQRNPVRYSYKLTAVGRALKPLLINLGEWGAKHIEGAVPLPDGWASPDQNP
jgi:DNA-binding HxlR family transcriptional regulator